MPGLPVYDAAAGTSLSWLAFACNVCLHFSQVPLMRAMLIDKDPASLARYAALPSLLQCSACSMWLAYSVCVLKSDALLANNVIGTAVSLLYALAFVLKRPTLQGKAVVAAAWLLAIAATLLIYGLLYFSPSQGPGSDATASGLTVAITCVLWASPLAALYSALTDLDDKRVPLPLTLSMLATVAIWLVVGVLVGDISLVVSSAVGVFFTLLQVAVYVYIRCRMRAKGVGKKGSSEAEGVVIRDAAAAAATA